VGRTKNDPVHQESDGAWWFWDETWGYRYGPYKSKREARKALNKYVKEVLG
jgi:hypothetical protein